MEQDKLDPHLILYIRQFPNESEYPSLGIKITYASAKKKKKVLRRDFPSGPAVKNLPCNAGDMGSIPGLQTKIPQAAGQQRGCPLQLRPNTAKQIYKYTNFF